MASRQEKEHAQALNRFKVTAQAEEKQRKRELEDLRFADPIDDTDQWPKDALDSRAGLPASGSLPAVPARPALTINELKQPIQQVQQQQRLARLGIEFSPEGADASLDDAEVFEDVARAVQTDSRAHLARNWAFDRAIKCGRGFYRIETDYVSDLTFDQKIVYKRIKNQFCVYFYPFCQEPDFSDAEWCFITEDMPWKEYQRKYKDSDLASFDDEALMSIGNDLPGWIAETEEGKTVRIAEYYYFDLTQDTLVAIQTDQGPKAILKSTLGEAYSHDLVIKGKDGKPLTRPVERRQLCWAKMNAVEFLDEEERDGHYIPVVPVIGDESNINGDTRYTGIVRPAIHAQRLFNVEASSLAEAVHLGPIAPFIGYAEQFEGYESWWGQLNTRRFPYLPVNPARDPASGVLPLPQRNTAEQPIQAIMVSLQQARTYVHDTTGIPPVALGQLDPNQRSGKAILALQKQSELGTSGYLDNLATLSLVLEGKILRDLIPIVYGQKGRVVPAQGEDDERRMLVMKQPYVLGPNKQPMPAQPGQPGAKEIDLEKGQYSVSVTVGKSHTTKRQEAAEQMAELAQAAPELVPRFADLWVKNMDGPGFKQIADRLKPPDDGSDPAQAQQQLQMMQQQMQQLSELADKNKTTLVKAQMDHQAEMERLQLELQSKERLALIQQSGQLAAVDAKINAENARTFVDAAENRIAKELELHMAKLDQVHAAVSQAHDHGHEATQAELDRQHEKELAQMGHEQALEQGQQQAALNPPNEASA